MSEVELTPATLAAIDTADDLRPCPCVRTARRRTPTWIRKVVVDGDLIVRGCNGTGSRWYIARWPARPDASTPPVRAWPRWEDEDVVRATRVFRGC